MYTVGGTLWAIGTPITYDITLVDLACLTSPTYMLPISPSATTMSHAVTDPLPGPTITVPFVQDHLSFNVKGIADYCGPRTLTLIGAPAFVTLTQPAHATFLAGTPASIGAYTTNPLDAGTYTF